MAIMKINVVESKSSYNVCYISKSAADILSLVSEKIYNLKFGQCSADIKLEILKDEDNPKIIIGANIFSKLGIPENIKTLIKADKNDIVLGPVLGVFLSPKRFKKMLSPSPPKSWINMIRANKNYHLFIYFFTTSGADWKDNKIQGCYYSNDKNIWVVKQLPLPDVVYDRCVGSKGEDIPKSQSYRKHFKPSGPVKRINSRNHLDKYWLYESIKNCSEIRQYLPETIKYNSADDVFSMLKKHKTVYLKSFYGNRGSEVMAVSQNEDKSFKIWYFESNNLITNKLDSDDELKKQIESFFKGKDFVVQQGIDLLEYNGRYIDMRVLIQKGNEGKWKCVYNTVFLGQKGSKITAGEEKGSMPYNFREIMPLILNKPSRIILELYKKIAKVCFRIAKVIDKEYGSFGEIGMDMALDKDMNIWFIEANSKPDRELEPGIIGWARCMMSCFNIIEYTKYLSGFNS